MPVCRVLVLTELPSENITSSPKIAHVVNSATFIDSSSGVHVNVNFDGAAEQITDRYRLFHNFYFGGKSDHCGMSNQAGVFLVTRFFQVNCKSCWAQLLI